jgi:hypothetical protein
MDQLTEDTNRLLVDSSTRGTAAPRSEGQISKEIKNALRYQF